MLTINMLGKCAIFYDNECISDKLSSKLVALICLLVLNRNRNMSKEKIIAYLWPDSDEEAAKSNLRFNLWNIRKSIPQNVEGEDFIISGKDFCRINEKYVFQCDKTRLDSCKVSQIESIDDLLQLKDLFQGDFLEGLYIRNCNEFNEMILFERVVCQNKQVEILEKLIGLYEEQERYEEELQILNEVAAIEPYNEQFAYQAVQIYGKLGNRTSAINYYKNFEIVLRRNLNISPNAELKQLYREMLESPCGSLKQEQKSVELPGKQIEINLCGLKGVRYYALASAIDQIVCSTDRKFIQELERAFLDDLSYLYSGFLQENEGSAAALSHNPAATLPHNPAATLPHGPAATLPHGPAGVPPVRIALAFLKFIRHVSRRYHIQIQITGMEDMDQISQNLLRHIDKMNLENITIRKN